MKIISAIFISSLLMLFSLSITTAQEDTIPYPPITPENANQLEMVQVLPNGSPSFQWSPDAKDLVVSTSNGTWIYRIDDVTQSYHQVLDHAHPARIIYSPRGDIYASMGCRYIDYQACYEAMAYIHDAQTHEILSFVGGVEDLDFSDDGTLVVMSRDHRVTIWDVESLKNPPSDDPYTYANCDFKTNFYSRGSLKFSPDASLVIVTSTRPPEYGSYGINGPTNYAISIWNVPTCTPKIERVWLGDSGYYIPVFSPDNRYVFLAMGYGYQSRWSVLSGELKNEFHADEIIISPDGHTMLSKLWATGDVPPSATLWDATTFEVLREFDTNNIQYLNDGRLLVVDENRIYIADATSDTPFIESESLISWVTLSKNNQRLVTGSSEEGIIVWDFETQTVIKAFDDFDRQTATLSPDNRYIIGESGNRLKLFDLETQTQRILLDFYVSGGEWIWSPTNGQFIPYTPSLYSGEHWTVKGGSIQYYGVEEESTQEVSSLSVRQVDETHLALWDDTQDKAVATYPIPPSALWNIGNATFAINENQEILLAIDAKLYNVTQNQLVADMGLLEAGVGECCDCEGVEEGDKCPYYYTITRTWLSADLRTLFSKGVDEIDFYPNMVLRAWDVATNTELYNYTYYGGYVHFTPDERFIVEMGEDFYRGSGVTLFDRSFTLIDARTGEVILRRSNGGFTEMVYDITFSPDGRFLFVESDTLRVWAVVPEEETP